MSSPLHIRYRPQDLASVVGQKDITRSLSRILQGDSAVGIPHAFLFVGPSGVGKTTIARIVAKELGCDESSIIELDAATYSSVEQMRSLTDMVQYRPISGGSRVVIVDEVHAASKSAFQAMLKSIEEPPDHVYWCLCTTEADKVPETIKTRCHVYSLKSVPRNDILDLLEKVSKKEGIRVPQDVLGAIVEKADGSVRRALVSLSLACDCKNRAETLQLLDKADDEDQVILFVREIVTGKGFDWKREIKRLKELQEQGVSPETLRLTMINYCNSLLLNSTALNSTSMRALNVLDALCGRPFNASDKYGPVLLLLGSLASED